MEAERERIVAEILKSGIVEKCVGYQTNRCKDRELVRELTQECWLWLCTYDFDKLKDAYDNRHLNALITRYLQNQFHSKNSPFYKYFRKFQDITDDYTQKEFNIPDA